MLTSPDVAYWTDNDLQEIIKSCDIKSTNLEMVLSGNSSFGSTFCGGYWMTTTPDRLNELEKFEFNHYGMANNHTMDYSYDGLRLTIAELDRRGLAHSGSGIDLSQATSASFVEACNENVAFITCTASCDDAARAGDASISIPGRPGVNMLRHSEFLEVDAESLKIIDKIAKETCINARFLKAVRMGIHNLPSEIHRLGRLQFTKGDKIRKYTKCNQIDLNRILNEIRRAKVITPYVIVGLHSHDIKGDTDDTPDDYFEEFAHACIDAGASAIIGTGTHQLKGIEIYKKSPIFYSLGNFLFVSEHMDFAPFDYYERYGASINTSLDEIWLLRSKNNTVGLEFDFYNYRSIVPVIEFQKGAISSLKLIPIELGFSEPDRIKGFPYIAKDSEAKEIFDRLEILSKHYKTKIVRDNYCAEVVVN